MQVYSNEFQEATQLSINKEKKKLVLFDGSSLAFRSFFAIHNIDSFVNKNGMHTNALFAFHEMMNNILEKEQPTHALVAWDAGKTTFRNEFFDEYKGGRQSTPSEFREQMPFFNVLLDAFGVAHYDLTNYEADDIIGTFATSVDPEEFDVVVISGDKDLTQLARDNVRVDITRKGVSELRSYTPASIMEEMGITPEQIVDMKGLMGDSSDNYPGVTGIGEKTALKLLHEYGSMEAIYEQIDDMKKSKRKENLINEKDNAILSKKLARIELNAPVTIELADLPYKGKQLEPLMSFYKDMNFNGFMSRLLENSNQADLLTEDWKDVDYTYVASVEDLTTDHFPSEPVQDGYAIYLENLSKNYHDSDIVAVAWTNGSEIFAGDASLLQSDLFKNWLTDEKMTKVVFDAKRTKVMLDYVDIDFVGVVDDVLIGSYLLHARDNSNDLAEVAREFDMEDLSYDESIYGKGAKRSVPEDQQTMYDHIARKVYMIARLQETIRPQLEANKMTDLYKKMELPLALVLANLEILGISVDKAQLVTMQAEFQEIIDGLEADIWKEAGREFNVNSTKQLGTILFEEMGLPVIKKTKTGYSTAQDVLEKLAGQAPIIDLILNYRQLNKLQSTYVEGLQGFIHDDGKIHSRFQQTLTSTGRLSSADPNLQNIPIRSEEGRSIRKAFVPSHDDWVIFSSDYSQIELRVLAHISGDKHMQEAFNNHEDIHTSTAMKVYNVTRDEVTPNMRRNAKAVNFGIVYGISDYGLSQNLNISRPEAKNFIDTYLENYPGVQAYMTDVVEKAKEDGYVETLFNRRRYLPDLHAKNFNVRSFAERNAMNTPIQGTAADIIKIAMVKMDEALKTNKLKANLLLQIHDELVFEVPKDEIETLEKLVTEIMGSAAQLDVPLEIESNYGASWYEAK